MINTILEKLRGSRTQKSLEEILDEAIDYRVRNKNFKVGDVVLTRYYSRSSHRVVDAHRVMVITRVESTNGGVKYEGLPLKTDRGKSNRYSDGFPNSIAIKDYSSILVQGEGVPYPRKEVFIDVADLAEFEDRHISPQRSSYAGHVTDEFYQFAMKALDNYKGNKDNSGVHWD